MKLVSLFEIPTTIYTIKLINFLTNKLKKNVIVKERKGINMKKEEQINYKIDSDVLKNYVEAINSIKEPMSQIKEQLNQLTKPTQELF